MFHLHISYRAPKTSNQRTTERTDGCDQYLTLLQNRTASRCFSSSRKKTTRREMKAKTQQAKEWGKKKKKNLTWEIQYRGVVEFAIILCFMLTVDSRLLSDVIIDKCEICVNGNMFREYLQRSLSVSLSLSFYLSISISLSIYLSLTWSLTLGLCFEIILSIKLCVCVRFCFVFVFISCWGTMVHGGCVCWLAHYEATGICLNRFNLFNGVIKEEEWLQRLPRTPDCNRYLQKMLFYAYQMKMVCIIC